MSGYNPCDDCTGHDCDDCVVTSMAKEMFRRGGELEAAEARIRELEARVREFETKIFHVPALGSDTTLAINPVRVERAARAEWALDNPDGCYDYACPADLEKRLERARIILNAADMTPGDEILPLEEKCFIHYNSELTLYIDCDCSGTGWYRCKECARYNAYLAEEMK